MNTTSNQNLLSAKMHSFALPRWLPINVLAYMKTNLRVVGVAGLALVMACAARGAVLPYSYSDPSSGTSPVPFSSPHTINVQQFDSSLGTLTSISFILNATMLGDFSAENPAANGGTRTVDRLRQDGTYTASYSGGTLVQAFPASVPVPPAYTLAIGETKTWNGVSGNDSKSTSYGSGWTYFNDYIGSGTRAVTLDALSYFGASGQSGVTYLSSAYGSAQFTVQYTYSPVPEPANVALGIFGAASLVVLVVRSRPVRSRIQELKGALSRWVDAV